MLAQAAVGGPVCEEMRVTPPRARGKLGVRKSLPDITAGSSPPENLEGCRMGSKFVPKEWTMTHRPAVFLLASITILASFMLPTPACAQADQTHDLSADFLTSTRCMACHNNLKTPQGKDVSIGLKWSASIMANAARDPYWLGSVRRETVDHPESNAAIQTECGSCHMPLQYLQDRAQHHETEVFSRLPLRADNEKDAAAADGVSCTACHQIQPTGLGTREAANANFTVAAHGTNPRPVFGPYVIDSDQVKQVHLVSTGYVPTQGSQIRDAALCASCHTLYTTSRGADGKVVGSLPEQMTYLEWQNSSYHGKQSCQECHMPAVGQPVAIASLFGQPRPGVRVHSFVGANFLMESMLNEHRDELGVVAQPADLAAAVASTKEFLQTKAAHVTVSPVQLKSDDLEFSVRVENLTGHKLPTAFPSRRAWLHVVVTATDGHVVFESGKLNTDGSIVGNANDADPTRYSPHYTRITQPDEVQIFEPILGDSQGHVTTGLLAATQYLKDNRILPDGFDKKAASADIAVHGKAMGDANFTAGSSTTQYAVSTHGAAGPFRISAELIYQPVGYRWAHNLASYKAEEPQRFVHEYEQAAANSALVLAHAEASSGSGH